MIFLIKRNKIKPNLILDIGCGKGAFTGKLKKVRPNSHIVGIDMSPTAIKNAKKTYENCKEIEFATLDIRNDLHLLSNSFNLVIMSQIIWYVLPEFKDIIDDIFHSILSKGGFLIINQAFYRPEQQTYGKEIVSTVDDLLDIIDKEPLEIIETNRFSNHNAIFLFKNKGSLCE